MAYLSQVWPTFCSRLESVLPSSVKTLMVHVLPWSEYPVAIYSIFTFEKQSIDTTRLRKELQIMEKKVESGLEVESTRFFEAAA